MQAAIIRWYETQNFVEGSSCCHSDGAHFNYRFRKVRGGWRNDSEGELLDSSSPMKFKSIEDAKIWANSEEKGWIKWGESQCKP